MEVEDGFPLSVFAAIRAAVRRLVAVASPATNGPVEVRSQRRRGGRKVKDARRDRMPLVCWGVLISWFDMLMWFD